MLAASLVAALHASAVLVAVLGGLVALRHRWVLLVHVPVVLAVVAVNLAGADCPLTELEQALRARAGATPYAGGFLEHYVFTPLGLDVDSGPVQAGQRLLVLVPNLLAYAVLARRWSHARRRRVAVAAAA